MCLQQSIFVRLNIPSHAISAHTQILLQQDTRTEQWLHQSAFTVCCFEQMLTSCVWTMLYQSCRPCTAFICNAHCRFKINMLSPILLHNCIFLAVLWWQMLQCRDLNAHSWQAWHSGRGAVVRLLCFHTATQSSYSAWILIAPTAILCLICMQPACSPVFIFAVAFQATSSTSLYLASPAMQVCLKIQRGLQCCAACTQFAWTTWTVVHLLLCWLTQPCVNLTCQTAIYVSCLILLVAWHSSQNLAWPQIVWQRSPAVCWSYVSL